jgi:hypothetical protein
LPVADINITHVQCYGWNNGSILINTYNGTAPYHYLWNTGATSAVIQQLSPDNYSVTVTDANGCSTTAQATITQPDSLSVSYTKTDTDCAQPNGEITLNVTGGTVPYNYLWSNNATSNPLSQIPAGMYEVIVSDANNCAYVLSIEIETADAPVIAVTSSDVSCYGGNDGSISVNVTGGTPPYSYSWNNGNTTSTITGLTAGPYLLTVTDASGCFEFTSTSIGQPDSTEFNVDITDVLCKQKTGTVNITIISGGTPPFSFDWSNGYTGNPNSLLEPGTYTVTITDAAGCVTILTTTVSQIDTFRITTSSTPAHSGNADGQATVTMLNGTPPYNILWSNGQTTATITGLSPGLYTVHVEDANGCEASDTIMVHQILAVSSLLIDNNISVFPNPTPGQLSIEWNIDLSELSLIITDVYGQTTGKYLISQSTEKSVTIDLNSFANGIYYLQLITKYGNMSIKKIIVAR